MTGKDLLEGMGYISSSLVEEAQGDAGAGKPIPWRKGMLLAAVIALTAVLAGCAVAYVLHIQDLQVGKRQGSRPIYAENGVEVTDYETVTQSVLTMGGLKGTAAFQAARNWQEVEQALDPGGEVYLQLREEGKLPELPPEYDAYRISSQAMEKKLEEILKTYDLQPAGEALKFRTNRLLYSAVGAEKLLTAWDDVMADGGTAYAGGNFVLSFRFTVPGEGPGRAYYGDLAWNRKDCFSQDILAIEAEGDWEEWNVAHPSGRTALILRSPTEDRCFIIWDRVEGILTLTMTSRGDMEFSGEGIRWDRQYLSKQQLEEVANVVDASVNPKKVTRADVENQPKIPESPTQNGWTLEMKKVETDGVTLSVTLGVTAPQGTAISHEAAPNDDVVLRMELGNYDDRISPIPAGEVLTVDCSSVEDGDGLDNTQNLVLKTMSFGSQEQRFLPGTRWRVHAADIVTGQGTLAQGEWSWEIEIGEENITDLEPSQAYQETTPAVE